MSRSRLHLTPVALVLALTITLIIALPAVAGTDLYDQ